MDISLHKDDSSLTDISQDTLETIKRHRRKTVTTPHYMLRRHTETKHMSPAIIKHLSKRDKLITMYYNTGRPIFNVSHDNNHYFIGTSSGVMHGYYKDCVIIPSLSNT